MSMPESINYDEYMLRAAEGDRHAFGIVYDGFVKKIYDYAFFRTRDVHSAEDVVADTFMKALERITTFDPTKGTVSSWLYRIARNTLVDGYRKKQKHTSMPEDYDVPDHSDLQLSLENKEMLARVETALQKLSEKEREIIILRVWDELSYKEIAHIMGKSEASLKMAASRALKSLRREVPVSVYLGILLVISETL